MNKRSSLTNKIRKEFTKKDTVTLPELYFTLEQDEELEHLRTHLKHRIRSSLYHLKKNNKIKLTGEGTYQLVKKRTRRASIPRPSGSKPLALSRLCNESKQVRI